MNQLYPTVTTAQLRDNPSAIYKMSETEPVVVLSRATPKVICVSPEAWNKTAKRLEDLEDLVTTLKSELALAKGEDVAEEITNMDVATEKSNKIRLGSLQHKTMKIHDDFEMTEEELLGL